MSGKAPRDTPQAVVRLVPGGGAHTARQIFNQWMYLSRRGAMPLCRCERHLAVLLQPSQMRATAMSWAREAGYCGVAAAAAEGVRALTTHLVVSFPPGTDGALAFTIGRAWAQTMFGSGEHGGTFDYVSACHHDRPHPHVHLVINRRALEGHWLKISRRHPELNYDRLRSGLVAVSAQHGLMLEATSRQDRGIDHPPPTYAEYRRQARRAAAAQAIAVPISKDPSA
jgi:type IV secretion system T-DNA border endonuclease VirD2